MQIANVWDPGWLPGNVQIAAGDVWGHPCSSENQQGRDVITGSADYYGFTLK